MFAPTLSDPPKLLSPREVAKLTGFGIATIRRRLADGSLPKFQPGGPGTRIGVEPTALVATNSIRAACGPAAASSQPLPVPRTRAADATRLAGPQPRWMNSKKR
jgi:hypothetical protein